MSANTIHVDKSREQEQYRIGAGLTGRERKTVKLSLALLGALLFVSNLAMAQENSSGNSGSWSGVIINSGCTVDEAFAEAREVHRSKRREQSWFYTTIRSGRFTTSIRRRKPPVIWETALRSGALSKATRSMLPRSKLSPRLGSPWDRRRPHFLLATSSARNKRSKALKGAHGTVLLFFRSADW